MTAGYSQKRSWRQDEMIVLAEEDRSGLEREIFDSCIHSLISAYETTHAEAVGRQKRNKEGALSAATEILRDPLIGASRDGRGIRRSCSYKREGRAKFQEEDDYDRGV